MLWEKVAGGSRMAIKRFGRNIVLNMLQSAAGSWAGLVTW